MKLFKFTKNRKKLFIILLLFIFGLLSFAALDILIEKQLGTMSFINDFCFIIIMFFFSLPAIILGAWFKLSFFEFGIGAAPKNLFGFIITLIFYVVLIYLISWTADLVKNKN